MAILLGVAQIVLQQAQSPALVGGGDVVIRVGRQIPASLLLAGTLQAEALRSRIATAAPTQTADLYLLERRQAHRASTARGGIPSLERALGDRETSGVDALADTDGGPRLDAQLAGGGAAAKSIGSIRCPTCRRGPTRGPSGSTSTAAAPTRAST